MERQFSRRTVNSGLLASALTPLIPAPAWGQYGSAFANERFRHGVASGDPDHDSVVLWTRVESDADAVALNWQVSTDPSFKTLVARGETYALKSADHTVKAIAAGLKPGRYHYYRFLVGGEASPTGRTQTLPTGRLDRLGIALATCSNYPFGYFNAYDAIARDPAVDFVLHTGDYIYEYGADGWGGDIGRQIGRVHEPANEITSLADYRMRHAQYKRDAGSLIMHATHPLLACWDDHESANNSWKGGAENHQPATEGSWSDRRAASIRAYYEWMPVREPDAMHSRAQFWRTYSFGDLATLVTLETRHTARGEQVDYREYADAIQSEADARRFDRDVIWAQDRPMISPAMTHDLKASIAASVAAGQPWRLIGSASTMARTLVPDIVGLGIIPDPETQKNPLKAARILAWKGKWNLPFYTDTWDGYPVAREQFYAACREAGATDLLVLAGDSHSFWANELFDERGNPMGLELGTSGITSPGDFIDSGFDPQTAQRLDKAFADHLDEVRWTDNMHQGYVRVAIGRDRTQADYVAMDNLRSTNYSSRSVRTEQIVRRGETLAYL